MHRSFVGLPQFSLRLSKILSPSMFLKLMLDLVFHFIQFQNCWNHLFLSFFPIFSMITNQSISSALETEAAAFLFPNSPQKAVLPFS